MSNVKSQMAVLQAHSLRGLVETVNEINASSHNKILKEDIVKVFREDESYFMLYYK